MLVLLVAWARLNRPAPRLSLTCPLVYSRSPMSLDANLAVPPFSEAQHRRIRVLPQFSTIVWASAWP